MKPDPSLSKTPNVSARDTPMLSAFKAMLFSLRYVEAEVDDGVHNEVGKVGAWNKQRRGQDRAFFKYLDVP